MEVLLDAKNRNTDSLKEVLYTSRIITFSFFVADYHTVIFKTVHFAKKSNKPLRLFHTHKMFLLVCFGASETELTVYSIFG